MTRTADYILSLIRALMQEQPLPPIPEEFSLQELFDFSRSHAIEALVFRGLASLLPHSESPVWLQWENRPPAKQRIIISIAFYHRLCYNTSELNIRWLVPLFRCFAEQRVKGKQVKDLYDLVTVNRRVTLHCAIAKVRRRSVAMTRKSGNLPAIGTG